MRNNYHPYLFENVSEEDYAFLKAREEYILEEVEHTLRCVERASPEEMAQFEKNKPGFGYNSKREVLAVSLKNGKKSRQLVISREDTALMSDFERKVFFAMRSVLQGKLEGIQLRKEDWE